MRLTIAEVILLAIVSTEVHAEIVPSGQRVTWQPGYTFNGGKPLFGATIDVMDHGCVADGVADDSSCIDAAIAAANDGDNVYLPAGIYRVSATVDVRKDIRLLGDGPRCRRSPWLHCQRGRGSWLEPPSQRSLSAVSDPTQARSLTVHPRTAGAIRVRTEGRLDPMRARCHAVMQRTATSRSLEAAASRAAAAVTRTAGLLRVRSRHRCCCSVRDVGAAILDQKPRSRCRNLFRRGLVAPDRQELLDGEPGQIVRAVLQRQIRLT